MNVAGEIYADISIDDFNLYERNTVDRTLIKNDFYIFDWF